MVRGRNWWLTRFRCRLRQVAVAVVAEAAVLLVPQLLVLRRLPPAAAALAVSSKEINQGACYSIPEFVLQN